MADLARAHANKPVDAADACQVVVHIHQTDAGEQAEAGGQAEQPERAELPCHLHDGPALHPAVARQAACEGATHISMRHRSDGTPLDAGRTTRNSHVIGSSSASRSLLIRNFAVPVAACVERL
jgi:hypothetical protein